MDFLPIILICHLSMPASECVPGSKNIIDEIYGDKQNTPMACLMAGQSKLASTDLYPKEGDGTYYVIKCVLRK